MFQCAEPEHLSVRWVLIASPRDKSDFPKKSQTEMKTSVHAGEMVVTTVNLTICLNFPETR